MLEWFVGQTLQRKNSPLKIVRYTQETGNELNRDQVALSSFVTWHVVMCEIYKLPFHQNVMFSRSFVPPGTIISVWFSGHCVPSWPEKHVTLQQHLDLREEWKLTAPHYTADSQYVELEFFQHSLALDHKYRGATLLSVKTCCIFAIFVRKRFLMGALVASSLWWDSSVTLLSTA